MRIAAIAAVLALAATAGCDNSETHVKSTAQPPPTPIVATAKPRTAPEQAFDFYVLALSWSPSYCTTEGPDANRQQCNARRPYAFVVHGLWPQFERGFPSDCKTEVQRVPDDLVRSLSDIMPSAGLIGHQWRRHGSCSGLAMEDYFSTLRAARDKVVIPADYRRPDVARSVDPKDVEAAFMQANPGLAADAISAICERRYLSEIRLCMTKNLTFRPCPELERRSCKAVKVAMPPAGG